MKGISLMAFHASPDEDSSKQLKGLFYFVFIVGK